MLGLLVACVGCAVPVATGLDDQEADRVVVALDRAGVDGAKEVDPTAEGKWRVNVPRDEVSQSIVVLREEELPRTPPAGVLDAVGKGSLVPSEAAEHAQLSAGIAGDLQRSLEGIEGVLSARVHLNLPSPSPMRETPTGHASASVLVEYRGSTPPITATDVQRLVSGACSALASTDVAVVMVSRPAPARLPGSELAHVGPVAVAHASARLLQLVLVGLVLAIMGLATALLVVGARLSRARQENADAQQPTVRR
jgi:type III secretion protein J